MKAARIQSGQIRAIHAIKTRTRLCDVSYRALLQGFGVASSKDLSEADAELLLRRMRDIPGASTPVERVAKGITKGKAAGRYAPKLQAMWLALYNLAVVEDRRDSAMHGFVKRQTGLDHTRFLQEAASAAAAIEALKAWLIREGVRWPAATGDRFLDIMAMKRAILRAQWQRGIALGAIDAFAPPEACDGLQDYASSILRGGPRRLGSIEDPSLEPADLDRVSSALGAKLRKAKASVT